jgi:hypothetical protein
VDANCHLNVDEGMATPSTADKITASGVGQIFEFALPQVSFDTAFQYQKLAFYFDGQTDTVVPGASFVLLLNGTPVTSAIEIKMTAGSPSAGQVVWTPDDFLVPIEGLEWNEATTRSGRITTTDGATKPVYDPWVPSEED